MINRRTTTKSTGKVEMTLESYNEMILELNMYRSAFSVQVNSYDTKWIEVKVDTKLLSPMITEEMKKFPEHVLDNYYVESGMSQYIAKSAVEEE